MPSSSAPISPSVSTLITDPSYGVVPTVRSAQCDLAAHVADALEHGNALAAEAGTGVGKTLAYTAQAVEFLLRRPTAAPIVIATATKALQAQIVERELPRLIGGAIARAEAEGMDPEKAMDLLTFAKKVGKKNHLCLRRVEDSARRRPELKRFLPIYRDFTDRVPGWIMGDADEKHPLPEDAWKYAVGYCNAERCKYHDACEDHGYLAAKKASEEARILVTNHAMVAMDLVLRRREGLSALPDQVSALILDEAHKFPDTLRETLSVEFNAGVYATYATNYAQVLYDAGEEAHGHMPLLPGITAVRATCEAFLRDRTAEPVETATDYRNALELALEDTLVRARADDVVELRSAAMRLSEHTTYGAIMRELSAYASLLQLHRDALALLTGEVDISGRYVLSSTPSQTHGDPPVRGLIPIILAGGWKQYLETINATPIYVSATLATGANVETAFAPFLMEMGRTFRDRPVDTFLADSPFDYATQAVLYTPHDAPAFDRNGDVDEYARELVAATRPLLLANEGHAFILFTSRRDLIAYENALGESDYPYPILSQCSSEQVRTRGASLFKRTPHATLLGLRTFFEGVDVPGLGLSLVIIPKLPFALPSAVLEAKRARYEDRFAGFRAVDVPVMLRDLRQMVGRLIRSVDDRGVVAVLDPRLHTKAYGAAVVASLGMPTRRTKPESVVAYLAKISERRAAAAAATAPAP